MDGSDGLDFYRIIAKDGENLLNEDGYIFLEIGYKQKSDVIKIFEKEKYKDLVCKKDLSGNDRVVEVYNKINK